MLGIAGLPAGVDGALTSWKVTENFCPTTTCCGASTRKLRANAAALVTASIRMTMIDFKCFIVRSLYMCCLYHGRLLCLLWFICALRRFTLSRVSFPRFASLSAIGHYWSVADVLLAVEAVFAAAVVCPASFSGRLCPYSCSCLDSAGFVAVSSAPFSGFCALGRLWGSIFSDCLK